MTAAPDQVDTTELAERLRERFPDVETARLFYALLDEVEQRRAADTPTRMQRLARERELRQLNATLTAEQVPLARRVEMLEDRGMSRTAAYRLATSHQIGTKRR